ncbi:5692_t:CDS:1, partial [Cetraspora pellucida]
MTQHTKTQDIDITSLTPPVVQSSRSNDTDSPPNLTDTPPNLTDTPPNVTDIQSNVTDTQPNVADALLDVQDIQDSEPPPYDQIVFQIPNIQVTPQYIHATPQIVQPLQPVQPFQPNINSTYPYTSQYFPQPYQPPIITNNSNIIRNNNELTNNPSIARSMIITIRTFMSM